VFKRDLAKFKRIYRDVSKDNDSEKGSSVRSKKLIIEEKDAIAGSISVPSYFWR